MDGWMVINIMLCCFTQRLDMTSLSLQLSGHVVRGLRNSHSCGWCSVNTVDTGSSAVGWLLTVSRLRVHCWRW